MKKIQFGEVVNTANKVVGVYVSGSGNRHKIFVPGQGEVVSLTITSTGVICLVPTREQVEQLQVGDEAPDCFGKMRKVVNVYHRSYQPTSGLQYVLYNTEFGPNSRITGDLTENTLLRTIALTRLFNSRQLDDIEIALIRAGGHDE